MSQPSQSQTQPRVMTQQEFEAYKSQLGAKVVSVSSSTPSLPQQQQQQPLQQQPLQQQQQQQLPQIYPTQSQSQSQPGVTQPIFRPQPQPLPMQMPLPLPSGMEPGILHGASVSCNCLGPLTFARLTNLPVRWEEVDLMKGDHLKESFLKMNPCHCVPTFKSQNGYALWESNSILRFLCNINPHLQQQWYPTDPFIRGKIDTALDWRQTSLNPTTTKLGYFVLFPSFYSYNKAEEDAATTKLEEHWKTLRYLLGGMPFIGGETPTIADISILSSLKNLDARSDVVIPDDIIAFVSRMERLLPPRMYKEVWSSFDALAAKNKSAKPQ